MRKLNYTQLAFIFVAAFVVFPLGRNITYGTVWSDHEYLTVFAAVIEGALSIGIGSCQHARLHVSRLGQIVIW
jgi:hypothetical protein